MLGIYLIGDHTRTVKVMFGKTLYSGFKEVYSMNSR